MFDLDPPADDFEIVRWTARQLGDFLTDLGPAPAVMTTGSRGLHLLVLLDRRTDFDTARAFDRSAAELLAARHSATADAPWPAPDGDSTPSLRTRLRDCHRRAGRRR